MIFGQILLKWLKKCHFLWSKFLKSANVPLPYHTVYAKNDPDLLYVLYLTCCNMTLHFTLINIVVVLFLLLLLHQTEVVQNVVLFFKKCQNQITSKLSYLEKMVIVSYLSLLVFWFILLFCSFWQTKCSENSFSAYFCNFWCTFWPYLAQTLLPT